MASADSETKIFLSQEQFLLCKEEKEVAELPREVKRKLPVFLFVFFVHFIALLSKL